MADENLAADVLLKIVERIERVEEDLDSLKDDRKDIYNEAKSQGFVPKTIRQIVALRKIEKAVREEAEALLETYKTALNL